MNNNQTYQHSYEVQEIVGKAPSWMVRWGISALFCTAALLLLLSLYIKYGEMVRYPISILSDDLPQYIVRGPGSRVTLLRPGGKVRANDTIAVAERGAGAPVAEVRKVASVTDDRKVASASDDRKVASAAEGWTVASAAEGRTVAPVLDGRAVTPASDGRTVIAAAFNGFLVPFDGAARAGGSSDTLAMVIPSKASYSFSGAIPSGVINAAVYPAAVSLIVQVNNGIQSAVTLHGNLTAIYPAIDGNCAFRGVLDQRSNGLLANENAFTSACRGELEVRLAEKSLFQLFVKKTFGF
jgi:hypothetical protein